MPRFGKLTLLCSLFAVGVCRLIGQSTAADLVKWQPVIGHEKELIVFVPSGFMTVVDDKLKTFRMTSARKAVTIKKTIKVARLINGTLLLISIYEANGREAYENLAMLKGLSLVSESTVGNFALRRFAGKVKGQYMKAHYFIGQKRLYEVTAYSREENHPIAEAFFASTRVADGDTYLAPNANDKDSSTPLPRLKEVQYERMPDSFKVQESDVDRAAVVLFQQSLRSTSDPGAMPQVGKITATALLSASGTVKDVTTGGTAPLELRKAFAETLKNLVFIPAEKDGKLVSVVRTFSWEMTVEVRTIGGPGPIPR